MTTLKERVQIIIDEHSLTMKPSEIIDITIDFLNALKEDTQEHEPYALSSIHDIEKTISFLMTNISEIEELEA